ncbi:hypothetical protein [Ktedonobacter racemifer]|uniref:hypothetical protein n=1 Tax=Ktedonobacter racemifer TaxID=363277 RepID=UPI0012FA998F|nr:hypothetical protein [Ktedonobacter racemifer]
MAMRSSANSCSGVFLSLGYSTVKRTPSVVGNGYDFMRCLAAHLRYKGLEGQRPEYGSVSLSWQAFGKRRPMDRYSSDLALWHLCPARHRASPARCTVQGAWQ